MAETTRSDEATEDADPAALAAAVLEEEAKRQAEQAAKDEETVLPDDLLPGVGDERMSLSDGLAAGGKRMLVVLFLLAVMDEFDRAAFSVLAPDIQDTIGMSDTVLAAIAGSSGALFVLGAVPMGALADRTKRTWVAAGATLVWSGMVALTGMVRNAFQMFLARAATGIGQSNVLPVHNALLTDNYPIAARGRIFGVYGMASPAGRVVAPVTAGAIAAIAGGLAGWRWAFIIIAIPAAVLGLVALTLHEPRRGQNEQQAVLGEVLEEREELPISMSAAFQRLKKIKTFYYLLVGVGALGFALFSIPLFLSLFLEDRYGLDAIERGLLFSVIQLAPLAAAPFAGVWADKMYRRSPVRLVLLASLFISLYGVVVVTGLYMPNLVLLTIVVAIGIALTFSAFVTLPPLAGMVIPYRLRSQGFALIGVYIFLFGAFGGAILTGWLSESFGERVALTIVAPPSSLIGGALIAYGSRYVRNDISLVVEELREEQEERARMTADPEDVPVLQVHNLDFSYGHVQVLFDVDVEVGKGETLALLGTNGAGKSTLLRAVSGLGIPDRGVVRLNGRTLTYVDAEVRFQQGVVQVRGGEGIFRGIDVEHNMRAALLRTTRDRSEADERMERAFEVFPVLRDRLADPAGSLSGGQQQMLAFGMALMHDPEILLVDELSLGLAPIVVQELMEVIEQLRDAGLTMVIVEQSVNVALEVAERAVFMEKGRIQFEGPAQELLERDDLVRAVFLGAEGG